MEQEKKKGSQMKRNRGITLIALIVTILIVMILAGMTFFFLFGEEGIIARAEEAEFKTRMSSMQETATLYVAWQVTQTENTNTNWINAGDMLNDMIQEEMLDITQADLSFLIKDILPDIKQIEQNYVAVYKGVFYYVSNSNVKNNKQQVKWCQQIGIPILYYEAPSGSTVVNGNYELVKGVYLCTPKLDEGFIKEKTRYLNIDENGNLVPGNWITDRASENWYDYKKAQWANIYVENNGPDCYYTWIPRYAFKLNQDTQRSDVKFIDVKDNSYIHVDEQENETRYEWNQLEAEGYQIPEAFSWVDNKGNKIELAGYWVSKYTLGELEKYQIDYTLVANSNSIFVKDFKTNTNQNIVKYTYALNGKIVKESQVAENYEFTNLKAGDNVINITALNSNGEIIGSMTKVYSPAIVNKPDLTGFNPDTTFYVTWDDNGVEHSETPIAKEAPTSWYEYGASIWANIVTRNNGQETYYTWVPRYEFTLDQTSQRSIVRFLKGTTTQTSGGSYQIPEAFSWLDDQGNKIELAGYWASKYTLGDETAPRFDAEVTATSNSIKTSEITGSAITTGQKYMYYIDGEYKETRTNAKDGYEYTDLEMGKQYTITIIVRNSTTEEYLGAITKQITTVEPNKPELMGFHEEITYYVVYDASGNEKIGDKIKADGSNAPDNWYDYSNSQWANIVVKTANATTYYTWIPRYEFKILPSQYKNTQNQRTEIRFIQGTSTQTSQKAYQIPEAFEWINEAGEKVPLTGYWVSKYTLGE